MEWMVCPHRPKDDPPRLMTADDLTIMLYEGRDGVPSLWLHLCSECAAKVRQVVYGDVIRQAVKEAAKEMASRTVHDASAE